ncbi:DUF669 domain-containing protein [Novipirellula artificiosorum]|uniref:DUF669 domain-containing protein n=1 Tax=Novipirellula artificiosorum TaxID=2528016 RepID=A0A5C6DA25_9BACT|nr:DUF669 domain-containing protein [Novipirellula artificiosorum]TWU33740.1 hypothetical protein Poly41_47360 [Novipirellula artificiosorum]
MGKLTDILRDQGKLDTIESAWGTTDAAADFDTLPKGEYIADIVKGDAMESRSKGTPGYRLTFEIVDGDHAGGRFWHEVWFTENAMSRTKRDLLKLGIKELRQLEKPLPAVFRCRVKLVIRRDDDGNEGNRVRRFDVIEVIKPEPDAFAPDAAPEPQTATSGDDGKDDDDKATAVDAFDDGDTAAGDLFQ